jgi:hypothetical protein
MEPEGSLPRSQESSSIQSIPSYPVSLRYILILSTHLRLDLLSDFFPLAFPTNILCVFLFFSLCYMPCLSHPPWLHHSNYIWRKVQVMKLLIMQFSPTSCHFCPRGKYSPQQRVLKHLSHTWTYYSIISAHIKKRMRTATREKMFRAGAYSRRDSWTGYSQLVTCKRDDQNKMPRFIRTPHEGLQVAPLSMFPRTLWNECCITFCIYIFSVLVY